LAGTTYFLAAKSRQKLSGPWFKKQIEADLTLTCRAGTTQAILRSILNGTLRIECRFYPASSLPLHLFLKAPEEKII